MTRETPDDARGFSELTRDELLTAALQVAVPLWAEAMREWGDEALRAKARECGEALASHGDDVLYPGRPKGSTASAFNTLAQALAVAALQPGGTDFNGTHYEVTR